MLPIEKNCLTPKNELEKKDNFLPSKEDDSVQVEKDERYTRINIKKSYDSEFFGKTNNTFVQTSITKDNVLKTKVTEIKKIFVSESKKKGVKNVVVREIVVDKLKNKKLKFENQISFEVDKNFSLLDALSEHFNLTSDSPLLLN